MKATGDLNWGVLAVVLFAAGLAWLAVRCAVDDEERIVTTGRNNEVEYLCTRCMRRSTLKLPTPRDYAIKFDTSFRLLHERCGR